MYVYIHLRHLLILSYFDEINKINDSIDQTLSIGTLYLSYIFTAPIVKKDRYSLVKSLSSTNLKY